MMVEKHRNGDKQTLFSNNGLIYSKESKNIF